MSLENLFDFIPAEPVIVRKSSTLAEQLQEAWNVWCDETRRPDRDTVDKAFRKTYLGMLKIQESHEKLLDVLRGAARTPVRPRDPNDTRRATMALSNYNHERAALSLLESGAEVIEYPRPDTTTTLSSLDDLSEAAGTTLSDWSESDFEASGILIRDLMPKELMEAAKKVKNHLGKNPLYPVDILPYKNSYRDLGGVASSSRASYGAGKSESEVIGNMVLDLDRMAKRMIALGKPIEEVEAFHNQAPPGFWDRAKELVRETPNLDEVYIDLEQEFGWHPSSRSIS